MAAVSRGADDISLAVLAKHGVVQRAGRWRCGDLVGYGEIQDFFELPQLTTLNADPATRAPVAG